MKYGFIKVAAAVPTLKVGDVAYNVEQIKTLIAEADEKGVEVIVFPELSLTGYTCQDLFTQSVLIDASEAGIVSLLDTTRQLDIISIVGLPVIVGDLLLNCAAVIQHGQLLGIVPKTYLPNYGEFYEKRWFASSQDLRPTEIRFAGNLITVSPDPQLFRTCDGVLFGVEICEDVWAPVPPSNQLGLAGADLIFNLSASDVLIGKHKYLLSLLSQQSARIITGYVYSGSGFGESTQDVVFGGNAIIIENGKILAKAERFQMESHMQMAQIDIERLRSERRTNSTYVNAQRNLKFDIQNNETTVTITDCRSNAPRDFVLERHFNPLPFIPRGNDREFRGDSDDSVDGTGEATRPYEHEKRGHRCQRRPRFDVGPARQRPCIRQTRPRPQEHHRHYNARLRHHRPHPPQCRRTDGATGCHCSRNQHFQGRPPAFRGHRTRRHDPRQHV